MNGMIKMLGFVMMMAMTLCVHAGGRISKPTTPIVSPNNADSSTWRGPAERATPETWRLLLNGHIMTGFKIGVEDILNRDVLDINARDSNGKTPLQLAQEHRKANIVKMLLDHGAIDSNPALSQQLLSTLNPPNNNAQASSAAAAGPSSAGSQSPMQQPASSAENPLTSGTSRILPTRRPLESSPATASQTAALPESKKFRMQESNDDSDGG